MRIKVDKVLKIDNIVATKDSLVNITTGDKIYTGKITTISSKGYIRLDMSSQFHSKLKDIMVKDIQCIDSYNGKAEAVNRLKVSTSKYTTIFYAGDSVRISTVTRDQLIGTIKDIKYNRIYLQIEDNTVELMLGEIKKIVSNRGN